MLSKVCFFALASVSTVTSTYDNYLRCDEQLPGDYGPCVGLAERCVDNFSLEPNAYFASEAGSAYDISYAHLFVHSASAFCRNRALAGTAQFLMFTGNEISAGGLRNGYCSIDESFQFLCSIPCDGNTHVFFKNEDVGSGIGLSNLGGEGDDDIRFSMSTRGNQYCISAVGIL